MLDFRGQRHGIKRLCDNPDRAQRAVMIDLARLNLRGHENNRYLRQNGFCCISRSTAGPSISVGDQLSHARLPAHAAHIFRLFMPAGSQPRLPCCCGLKTCCVGVPDGRVGEFVAMLAGKNMRVLVEFESIAQMPAIGIRLGVQGIGASLPPIHDENVAVAMAEKLVKRANAQKAFAFLDQIDTPSALVIANHLDFRFGTGAGFGNPMPVRPGRYPGLSLGARASQAGGPHADSRSYAHTSPCHQNDRHDQLLIGFRRRPSAQMELAIAA